MRLASVFIVVYSSDTTSLLQSIAVVNLSALDPDGGEGGDEARYLERYISS